MAKDRHFDPLAYEANPTCESYLTRIMTKSPFWLEIRVVDILGLIYTNICGFLNSIVRYGFCYFIIFTDDHLWLGYVYLMKYTYEMFEKFKEFKNEDENKAQV